MVICSHCLAQMCCGQPHLFGHMALSFCGVTFLLSRVAFALCRLALCFCRFPFVFRLLPLLFDSHGRYLLEKRTIGKSTLSKTPRIPHPLSRSYSCIHTAIEKNVTTSQPWSTSRTPTPVPRKSRLPHHIFGDFLCTCRCLEQLLGDLACFLGKQHEE